MEPGGGTETASQPLTAEEEALKRNTDCIYFLASPLTCKKGNECEYRHSEGARVNPRDCWYWLNGNCLNPKCLFRHPPLDGLFGIPGSTSVPALPSQTVSAPQIPAIHAPASNNLNKQIVPCYYFQKGQCLKGDKCPFMHGPQPIGAQPTGTPVPQQAAKVSAFVVEPRQTVKKESWVLKGCTSQQNIPNASIARPDEAKPLSIKPVNDLARSSSPYLSEFELPRTQPTNVPASSGHQSQPADERLRNGRGADEFFGESSPGFDVLVDGDIGESDYLNNEDDFGRESVQGGGRNLYPVTEFNYNHSDYEPVSNLDRDQSNGKDKYDGYGQLHSHYAGEQRRSSSERIGVIRREESPDQMGGSDLRHRLLKQRRLVGSRSAVSPDRHGRPYRRDDHYVEGERRHHGRHSYRDQRHFPQESSISTRLQGRIKLPVRSSPDRSVDMRSDRDRDRDRDRHRGRSSPTRLTNYAERNHDRMKRRSHEDLATDARNFISQRQDLATDTRNFRSQQPVRRDDSDPLNFAGPKSLAELKGTKISENSQEQSTKSINARLSLERKSMESGIAVDCQESEGSFSFEGPNLKRKREFASENGAISGNGNENNYSDGEGVKEELPAKDTTFEEEEEGLIPEAGEINESPARDTVEMEESLIVDTVEDREVENSDQRNEESDYDTVEGEDIIAEDDENMYLDGEEELEDDDEDDFARKVGVMFS